MRVSLNSQLLQYDPVCDSGINVGYNNREQTVGPGESKKYLWCAGEEYGACIIQSFGDMRNHRYHGLFGAVISASGIESFREYVLFVQNGIRLLDVNGELIKTASGEADEEVDAEDKGEVSGGIWRKVIIPFSCGNHSELTGMKNLDKIN